MTADKRAEKTAQVELAWVEFSSDTEQMLRLVLAAEEDPREALKLAFQFGYLRGDGQGYERGADMVSKLANEALDSMQEIALQHLTTAIQTIRSDDDAVR